MMRRVAVELFPGESGANTVRTNSMETVGTGPEVW